MSPELARDRAGIMICLAEIRHGRLADVRELARRMVADQQCEVHQLHALRQAWSTQPQHGHLQASP
jgi:uncharacterized protein (DUF305 family)